MAEEYETYQLGDWELQSGQKIANAHIAYKTFGDPKSPAIVYPSWFSGGKYPPGQFNAFHPVSE
jgi:homoserine O-acetyltransferase